jgi:hypothetical protein
MRPKTPLYLLILVVVLAGLSMAIYKYALNIFPESPLVVVAIVPQKQTENAVVMPVQTEALTASYSYLFAAHPEPHTGNIVGYFAGGAFGWYVPDWLFENWTGPGSTTTPDGSMVFAPKTKSPSDPALSPITFTVKPSSETFNAASLYDDALNSHDSTKIIINEILLSKHGEGGTTIVMETGTRIYHVQKEFSGTIEDLYFIDGNGKTLELSFVSDADIFPQFSEKIRDLVEGIGEIKPIQG